MARATRGRRSCGSSLPRARISRRFWCSTRSWRGSSPSAASTTKQQLIDWCAENARLPAREYWDDMWVQTRTLPLAVAGVEPYASRLKAKPDEIVQMFEPKDINVVVVGGGTQGAWKTIGARFVRTLSIDAWR